MFLCLVPFHFDVEREKAVRSFAAERLLPRLQERPGFQGTPSQHFGGHIPVISVADGF